MMPAAIDNVTMAFPTDVVGQLMPPMSEIPEKFRVFFSREPWTMLASKWFFSGLKGAEFTPAEGIDEKLALRHLIAILRSFEPKHEHKQAAVAYLLSQWFAKVTIDGKQVAP